MSDQIHAKWYEIPDSRGLVYLSNGQTLLSGTYIKYDNYTGSMTLTDAQGNIVVWHIAAGVHSIHNVTSSLETIITNIPLHTSAASYVSDFACVSCKVGNIINVTGYITFSTQPYQGAAGMTICNLPYLPNNATNFITSSGVGAANTTFGYIDINGLMRIYTVGMVAQQLRFGFTYIAK